MFALTLAEDGRILSSTYAKYASADAVLVEKLPDGVSYEYCYVDGDYVYDPLPKPEPVEPEPERSVWDELDAAYQEGVDSV